jgi:long-chain acyl-CoA synthetase
MTLGDIIRLHALKQPDKTALVYGNIRLSYYELNERINRLSNGLIGIGIKKEDRVAVIADNCSEYVETYFATAKCGMIIVPINSVLKSDELEYIINDSQASTLIFGTNYFGTVSNLRSKLKTVKYFINIGDDLKTGEYQELIAKYPSHEPPVHVDENDIAWLLYTSGTTGLPKGVMLTHKSQLADAANTIITCYQINKKDVHLNLLPMFHIGAMWHIKCHFYMGSTNVLLNSIDPIRVLETMQRERITTTGIVPPMAVSIINHPDINKYDVSSIRMIIYAGAPMSEAMLSRMKDIFGDVSYQVYALTEGGPGIIMPPLTEGVWEKVKRAGSCGKEVLNVEVRLINEVGNDCAPGEVGEIIARGDNIMKGYWNMPEATAKTMEGGYLHTGDLATKDREGYYYITGRKKDAIITDGKSVHSAEVENVISSYPGVSEAAVIGVANAELGEIVKALIVMRTGEKVVEQEIINWCISKLDDYKVPKMVHIVDSLPKTPSGKVLKAILREKYK